MTNLDPEDYFNGEPLEGEVELINIPLDVTTDENGKPTKRVQAKVAAAAIGSGTAGAAVTLGVWIFETATAIDLPSVIEGSIFTLVVAGAALVAGYVKKPSRDAF